MEMGDSQLSRWPRAVAGDAGADMGNYQVLGVPIAVDNSVTRVSVYAEDRCIKISDRV